MKQLYPVLIIRTPLGDAIRLQADVEKETDTSIQLKPGAFCLSESSFDKASVATAMYSADDLPDPARVKAEISNICGFVEGYSMIKEDHPAWRMTNSALGCFREVKFLVCV